MCYKTQSNLPSGHPIELISPLELRVAELMHHMKIESAVAEGAKNVVKQLSGRKVQDRRILAEVGTSWMVPVYTRYWYILYLYSINMFHCGLGNNGSFIHFNLNI